ncbi:MAG: hypothetical protein KKH61_20710 [Gammaproteobacteria bacterium]|nr:hypothetical protein [Gammaproteobacteria bacterium]
MNTTNTLYENAFDLANERAVAVAVAEAWGCRMFRFGKLARIDYAAVKDDRIHFLAEIKCRTCSSARYEKTDISALKFCELISSENKFGVPAILFIRFTDSLLWARPARASEVSFLEKSRPDKAGSMLLAAIPLENFKNVERGAYD